MSAASMEVRSMVFGKEDAQTLSSMVMVKLAKELGGKYKEAEAMNRQTLVRREKVLGTEHPDTLTSMSNLALVLNSQGKYEEAEVMNRQTLASISNSVLVLDMQGKYDEAEAINGQTLSRTEKVLGIEHPDTLTSMGNLELVLNSQGKYEEAEAMNRQMLERREGSRDWASRYARECLPPSSLPCKPALLPRFSHCLRPSIRRVQYRPWRGSSNYPRVSPTPFRSTYMARGFTYRFLSSYARQQHKQARQ